MNFLERTLAARKVKQAEKAGKAAMRFAENEKLVKTSIYTRQTAMPVTPSFMPTSGDVALWFVKNYTGTQSLYVLTHTGGEILARGAIPITDGLTEVAAFADALNANENAATLGKCSELAAASIVCAIGKIKEPIQGYTMDKELAEAFTHSLDPDTGFTVDTDLETLREAWRTLTGSNIVSIRDSFLKNVFGKCAELVPDAVRRDMMLMNPTPFGNAQWYVIVHQIKLGRPLEYAVFKAISQSDVLKSCLGNGTRLDGLDFSEQTQLAVIQYAAQNNRNIGELKDGETWKSIEEMKAICHQWKNSPAPVYDGGADGEYYGDAYAREREERKREWERDREEQKREREHEEQLRAMRAQANAVLDAQIAQLKIQLDNAYRDFRLTKRISQGEYSAITHSIKQQIDELERKKQR